MPFRKLKDMTLKELRWHYVRQLEIHRYCKERGEDTTGCLARLDELGNRIVELGGELPKPDWAWPKDIPPIGNSGRPE